ncbi:MAG: hypothetical protein LBG72_01565 [Spirochaetaceae bacterium]|jgi:hypothetical protein|nr:hypothetical protein [Spirochaetaceae bacterium]
MIKAEVKGNIFTLCENKSVNRKFAEAALQRVLYNTGGCAVHYRSKDDCVRYKCRKQGLRVLNDGRIACVLPLSEEVSVSCIFRVEKKKEEPED